MEMVKQNAGGPIDEVIEAIKRRDRKSEKFLKSNRKKLEAKLELARDELNRFAITR